jgi:hypothetical protein
VLLPLPTVCLLMALIPLVLAPRVRARLRIMALVRVLWRGMFMFRHLLAATLLCCLLRTWVSRDWRLYYNEDIALTSNGRMEESCILGPNSNLLFDEK